MSKHTPGMIRWLKTLEEEHEMKNRLQKLITQATELKYETYDNCNQQYKQHYEFNKQLYTKLIQQDTLAALADWSTAVAGLRPELLTPSEVFDRVHDELVIYYKDCNN